MPSWYRRVDIRMEGDAKYRALSGPQPNGKSLWERLLYGSHTLSLPGLSVAGEAQLAEGLGWPLKGFREAFGEVSTKGMAKADWEARVVWVPNAIRYNPPESPNVVKSWGKLFNMIPECALKAEAHAQLKAFIEALGEGYAKAFQEAFGEDYAESPSPSPSLTPTHKSSAEPREDARSTPDLSPVIGQIPLVDGTDFAITEAMAEPWGAAYPACDIPQEIAKARAWCLANPTKRKTRRGAQKFINGWLDRAQNRSQGGGASASGGIRGDTAAVSIAAGKQFLKRFGGA